MVGVGTLLVVIGILIGVLAATMDPDRPVDVAASTQAFPPAERQAEPQPVLPSKDEGGPVARDEGLPANETGDEAPADPPAAEEPTVPTRYTQVDPSPAAALDDSPDLPTLDGGIFSDSPSPDAPPPPAEPSPGQPNPTGLEAEYIGNRRSKKLHHKSCHFAERTAPDNREGFSTAEAAEQQGYERADCID